jgi:hypothetical protein
MMAFVFARPRLPRLFQAALAFTLLTAAASESGKSRESAVLARVLSYELTLEDRVGDEVGVAVVFKQGDVQSEAIADEWFRGLSELSAVRIKDRRFFALKVPYDPKALATAIEQDGVDVLLASDGLGADAAAIAELARSRHVLVASNSAIALEQATSSLCVTQEGGKPKIFINLSVAQQEGIRFSSSLLKLVTLVR